MELQCTVGNLNDKEHGFLSSVLTVFCDPKYEHLRKELMAGEASLRAKREGEFSKCGLRNADCGIETKDGDGSAGASHHRSKDPVAEGAFYIQIRGKWALKFHEDLVGRNTYEVVTVRRATKMASEEEAHETARRFGLMAYQVKEVRS